MENYKVLIEQAKQYFGVIYTLRNKLNGRLYVGQTTNFKRRMKEYRVKRIYKKSMQYALMEDIIKHRYDNFDVQIIDHGSTVSELHEKEIHWISEYNSTDLITGYNKKAGGAGGKMTDDSKEKMRVTTGQFRHSEETKKLKSIPIVVFKDCQFEVYDGAKSYADIIGTDKSVVSSSIRNCKTLHGARLFYLDKNLRDKVLNQNASKRGIGAFREIAKHISEDVETIESRIYIIMV